MEYIDTDKLIAEIRRIVEEETPISKGSDYYHGVADTAHKLLSFIDSLLRKQLEVDLDADIEMEWDSFKKHLTEYDNDPEEVIWLDWYNFNDIARYFHYLGLITRKEE